MAQSNKLELLLHPLRMRIITEMMGRMTAQELAELMPDVSQATLYRHINKLVAGDVLQVVEEIPVRGTVQKVYDVNVEATKLKPEDLEGMSKDDMLKFFNGWVSGLIGEFSRFLNSKDEVDIFEDRMMLMKTGFWATKPEVDELISLLQSQCNPLFERERRDDRLFWMWSSVLLQQPRK